MDYWTDFEGYENWHGLRKGTECWKLEDESRNQISISLKVVCYADGEQWNVLNVK